MTIVFLDTETTSLRHDRRAWDVGIIVREPGHDDVEHQMFIQYDDLDLGNADLMSLKIGKFFERHPHVNSGLSEGARWAVQEELEVLAEVEAITRGAFVVGAVPWFDTEVLGNRMRANGLCPSWHYHLIDVETLAAGQLRLPPKWDFDSILGHYGLAYNEADRHTALGDARLVRDLYDKVMAA